jgi:hypothetical protein
MSDTIPTNFTDGELLVHRHRDGGPDSMVTIRNVLFRGYGEGGAIVAFGVRSDGTGLENRYSASVDELSRPAPPERPWWVPPPVQPTTPTAPPHEAKTATRLAERLGERRATLRQAHETVRTAQEATAAARQVADRAREQVTNTRAELARQNVADQTATNEFAEAIRKGEAPPPHRNGVDREALRSRVAMAEQAKVQLDAELSVATSTLTDALSSTRRAAADVVAALIERECESLRRLEEAAARQRAELVAVSRWWPDATLGSFRLSHAASTLLANPPNSDAVAVPVSGTRIEAWKNLFTHLVNGDAAADFKLEG